MIRSLDEFSLRFLITGSNNNELAVFDLVFNHKYPFEAPKMKYHGPRYDFCTTLQLSIDFDKFNHNQWTIRESLVSILDAIFMIIADKIPSEARTQQQSFWTEEEGACIKFLKEIDCFQNSSFFEDGDCSSLTVAAGKGTGYGRSDSNNNDNNCGSNVLQRKKKELRDLFSISARMIQVQAQTQVCSPLLQVMESKNVLDVLTTYVEKNTFLNIADLRDSLGAWTRRFPEAVALRAAVEQKTRIKEFFSVLSSGPNLILKEDDTNDEIVNRFVSTHHFRDKITRSVSTYASTSIGTLYSRILLDIMDLDQLSRDESSMLRLAWCPTGPFQLLRLLISSRNDPYTGGMFEFHVYFPNDYPQEPPQVHLMTTASGTVRFNPNLYNCGKVCLSLLGTWSGEQWNPILNNMVHVVLAISVMIFTDQPVQNEPAYSSSIYFDPDNDNDNEATTKELLMVRKYKFHLRYMTLKHAILEPLSDPASIFYDAAWSLFEKNRGVILKLADEVLAVAKDEQRFKPICDARYFQTSHHQPVVDLHHYATNYEALTERVQKLFKA
jgi:baculoviral IAP repeat-containing protein 6